MAVARCLYTFVFVKTKLYFSESQSANPTIPPVIPSIKSEASTLSKSSGGGGSALSKSLKS